jgi:hypothetical protein
MRTNQRTSLVVAVVASLGASASLVVTSAAAQTAEARRAHTPLAQSLQGAAKDAYTAAAQLFKQGDFQGAEVKYTEAYDLSKDPRLVFDMAVCEKELHHYARMGVLLRRFEQEGGSDLSDEDRRKTDDALAALPKYVGTVTVSVDTTGAAVTVDGESTGATPLAAPLSLDPGKHVVVVRKDGYEAVERPISVSAGAATTLTIGLLAQGAQGSSPSDAAHPPAGALPTEPPPAKAGGLRWTPLAYAGAGLAAVGLVVGGVTGGLSLAKVGSVKNKCSGTLCPTTVDDDLQSARTLGTVSTVAFIAAGLGTVAGAIGLFAWPRREVTVGAASVSVAPWVGPGTAGIAGAF